MIRVVCSQLLIGLFLFMSLSYADAGETITTERIGGSNSVLILPKSPVASVILLAGGEGTIGVGPNGLIDHQGNQVVRTRMDYSAHGFAVLVPDAGYDLAALVEFMKNIKRPVVVVATSRGTKRAAIGIAAGVKPDKLVLTSGLLSDDSGSSDNVINILQDPNRLPPTLILHHRQDHCRVSKPDGVSAFMKWAGTRAKVIWLQGGIDEGDPCQPKSYHGFNGLDKKIVELTAGFVK